MPRMTSVSDPSLAMVALCAVFIPTVSETRPGVLAVSLTTRTCAAGLENISRTNVTPPDM